MPNLKIHNRSEQHEHKTTLQNNVTQMYVGRQDLAAQFIEKTESIMSSPGVLPELYYSGTNIPNPNTPLGWSSAMYILAKERLNGKIGKLWTA